MLLILRDICSAWSAYGSRRGLKGRSDGVGWVDEDYHLIIITTTATTATGR